MLDFDSHHHCDSFNISLFEVNYMVTLLFPHFCFLLGYS